MSRQLLSDSATSADWGFVNDEELVAAIDLRVGRYCSAFGLDADDAKQEVYLWLAVRPKIQRLEIGLVLHKIMSRLQSLNKQHQKRRVEDAFDDELDHLL